MAISDEKVRVALTLDTRLLERVDNHCQRYGLTRSAFFASLAADKFASADKVADMSAKLSEKLVREWMDDYAARMEPQLEAMFTPDLMAQVVRMMGEAQTEQE